MGQGISSHMLKQCLFLGCEACVIIAQDISVPIFTPGILVPQWEITSCDKTVCCLCINFQEPGTCHCSEGSFEVFLHLSSFHAGVTITGIFVRQ